MTDKQSETRAWTHDPDGRPYPPAPMPRSPGWFGRNMTLSNILAMCMLLVGLIAWMRTTEAQALVLRERVASAEARLKEVDAAAIKKDVLAAQLAVFSAQLKAIDDRLARIEAQR